MDSVENNQALQLLRELDERQDLVLTGLDELNARVEKVLELYLGSRQSKQPTLQADMLIDNPNVGIVQSRKAA